MRAAIYLRRSPSPKDESVSLETQQETCEQYAARMGWQVVGVWSDPIFTGRRPDRPQYQAMLAAADRWDVLLTYKLDRAGRQELEFHRLIADLDQLGKVFASATQDVSDPLMRSIHIAFAAEESRRTGARVRDAKAKRARDGYWPQHAPFGTINEKGILRPDPDRIWMVREVFARIAGGASFRETVRWLNSGPLAGRPLSTTTVWEWIGNPVWIGQVRWNGHTYPGRWPPLVDPEVWEQAARALRSRQQVRSAMASRDGIWITGLAVCAECGHRMGLRYYKTDGRGYFYLHCRRYRKGVEVYGCGDRPRLYAVRKVQEDVLEQVETRFLRTKTLEQARAALEAANEDLQAEPEQERAMITAELRTLTDRRDRIEEGFARRGYTFERMMELKGDVDQRIVELGAVLSLATVPALIDVPFVMSFLEAAQSPTLFARMPAAELRNGLKFLVKEVRVPGVGRPADVVPLL